jgi:hypothetical protein
MPRKLNFRIFIFLIVILAVATSAMAQHRAASEALIIDKVITDKVITQEPAPAAATALLKEGAEVNLKFAQDLSSKTAAEDDRVNFELAEDLKAGDVVVARAGAKAVGTVSHVKKAGMMGKGGELNVRLEYIKIGDSRIRLRANKGKEGEDKTGTAVVLTVLFGPIGLIKHGKNVEVKSGAPLKAFVDEDIKLPADTSTK